MIISFFGTIKIKERLCLRAQPFSFTFMQMIISFQKKEERAILHITRSDGSTTKSETNHIGVIHDLCHYCVEQLMEFDHAFYGLIDEGYDVDDFEKPRYKRPEKLIPKNLPVEAKQAEHMAGLFQLSLIDPGVLLYFQENLKMALDIHEIPYPDNLDDSRVLMIADRLRSLIEQWNDLETDAKLTLS